MVLRIFACGDIADRCRHQDAFGAVQRAQHDLDREIAAVLPASLQLDPHADMLCQRLCRGSKIVRDEPFREAFRNDGRHLLSQKLIPGVSELLLSPDIQQDDLAGRVHHHHRVRSRLQQSAISGLTCLLRVIACLGNVPR
jgi:hypothetical protein